VISKKFFQKNLSLSEFIPGGFSVLVRGNKVELRGRSAPIFTIQEKGLDSMPSFWHGQVNDCESGSKSEEEAFRSGKHVTLKLDRQFVKPVTFPT
jgi:hypothetical protein